MFYVMATHMYKRSILQGKGAVLTVKWEKLNFMNR